MANNLFERIKHTVEKFRAQLPTYDQPEAPTPPAEQPHETAYYTEHEIGYIPAAQMVSATTRAAREQRLLYIRYKGVWRHIEPYEFKGGQKGLLVYAWCLIDNKIHSFYLFRIQEMYLTDVPFTARFPIKI